MFEGLDALMIRMMAEFVKQILPISALFAGVTMAVAFVQRGTGDDVARDRVVRLLTMSSMAMICSICASSLFLVHFGVSVAAGNYLVEGKGLTEHLKTLGADFHLEAKRFNLLVLWSVAFLGAGIGVFFALTAIGVSGFMKNEAEGKWTLWLMVAVLVVIGFCFALLYVG